MVNDGIIRVLGATLHLAGGGSFTNNGTIANAGSIVLDGDVTLQGSGRLLVNPGTTVATPGGATLTNGANHTIQGIGTIGNLVNQGTIRTDSGQPGELVLGSGGSYTNDGRIIVGSDVRVAGTFTNLVDGILTGGRYDIFGKLTLPGDVTTNRATIVIGGQGEIVDFSDTPAHLNLNDTGGSFTVLNSQYNATPGTFTNQGAVELVGSFSTFHADGAYQQNSGSTKVDGTLIATEVDLNGGLLSGTGQIQADVYNNGGILAPGDSPGTITIAGNYHQGVAGQLNIEFANTSSFDQVFINGHAYLNGALNLQLDSNFDAATGQQFLILSAFGITGDFSTFFSPYFANSKMFREVVSGNQIFAEVTNAPEPAMWTLLAFGLGILGLWKSRFHRPFND